MVKCIKNARGTREIGEIAKPKGAKGFVVSASVVSNMGWPGFLEAGKWGVRLTCARQYTILGRLLYGK